MSEIIPRSLMFGDTGTRLSDWLQDCILLLKVYPTLNSKPKTIPGYLSYRSHWAMTSPKRKGMRGRHTSGSRARRCVTCGPRDTATAPQHSQPHKRPPALKWLLDSFKMQGTADMLANAGVEGAQSEKSLTPEQGQHRRQGCRGAPTG